MADYSTIARPYARALLEVAQASGDLDGWSAALAAAAAVLGDARARRVIADPRQTPADQARFVGDVCADVPGGALLGSQQGRNLLMLLAENDRLNVLPEIAAQFEQLKARAENRVNVTLVAATEVDDAVADTVARSLEQRLGRTVQLTVEVDPSLIGGAVIRAEDMVIDGSVRSRLQRLADALVE
jgi:F-type H+-transporting ATPase subunit delta